MQVTERWSSAMAVPRYFQCRLCGEEVFVSRVDDKRTVFCCQQHEREYWRHRDRYERKKDIAAGHVTCEWRDKVALER